MIKKMFPYLLLGLAIVAMFLYRGAHTPEPLKAGLQYQFYPLSKNQQEWIGRHPVIRFGIPDNIAPLLYLNDQQQVDGLFGEFFRRMGEAYGIRFQYQAVPRNKAETLLKDGQIDCILMRSASFSDQVCYTMPLAEDRGVLFLRQSADSTVEAITPAHSVILLEQDDPAIPSLQKTFPEAELILTPTLTEAAQRFIAGEATAISGSEPALRYYLAGQISGQNLKLTGDYTFEKKLCLALRQNNQTLFDILNNAVYHFDMPRLLAIQQSKWFGISYALSPNDLPARTGMLILILIAATLGVFLLFYQSNKSLYGELQSRMQLLIESQNELQTTFDGVTYFLAEVDREGRILNINKSFCQYLGRKRHEITGQLLDTLLPMDASALETIMHLIKKTYQTEEGQADEFPAGRRFFDLNSFLITDNRGKLNKILLMFIDTTDARNTERQMLQDSKMIAIGQLASGVAHEIRNPLGLIRNYCYVLKSESITDFDVQRDAIRVIEESVDRAGRIIENLLNFSRISRGRIEEVNLPVHIRYLLDIQQSSLLSRQIQIHLSYLGPEVVPINVEAIDLILINLLTNAADAITQDHGEILVDLDNQAGQQLTLQVTDTGVGIPPEKIDEIYNPFFTTKPSRRGTGLGLYLVYNEVTKMNGTIEVESNPDKGTVFKICVPLIKSGPNPAAEGDPHEQTGAENISS